MFGHIHDDEDEFFHTHPGEPEMISLTPGEAAKKNNAEAVSALFAEQAGKFVCATAGPNLEAVMAAFGSGAAARSARRDGVERTVLNVDMGGGTAKYAICRNGEVLQTAAIHGGARLVAMHPPTGLPTPLEPA